MAVFYLKYRDTRPILEAALLKPDLSAHDLTGSTSWKLHVRRLNGSTVITRDMVIEGLPTAGLLRYAWLSTDWDVGGLTLGAHIMEYEVIAAGSRLTFPNDGHDLLQIVTDLGQG